VPLRASEAGARGGIDRAERLLNARRNAPIWMLKANTSELASIAGRPTDTPEQRLAAARSVQTERGGNIEWVVATAGADGVTIVGPRASSSPGSCPFTRG